MVDLAIELKLTAEILHPLVQLRVDSDTTASLKPELGELNLVVNELLVEELFIYFSLRLIL